MMNLPKVSRSFSRIKKSEPKNKRNLRKPILNTRANRSLRMKKNKSQVNVSVVYV